MKFDLVEHFFATIVIDPIIQENACYVYSIFHMIQNKKYNRVLA